MMSLYLVTDQYEPYMPFSHQCTGSSRRRRSKYGYQMSSWYSRGWLTSILSSGIVYASSRGSTLTGAFIAFHPCGRGTARRPRDCTASLHVVHFVRHFIEGGVAVDLRSGRLEQHVLVRWIRGGDRRRWHDPDGKPLAAAGIDVARGLQRHRRVGRVNRADMPVRKPGPRADEHLPQRGGLFGHRQAASRRASD